MSSRVHHAIKPPTRTLRLPEAVRLDLLALQQQVNSAQEKLNIAAVTAYNFLGLDPAGQHNVDLKTGIVVPAALPKDVPLEPEPQNQNGKVE